MGCTELTVRTPAEAIPAAALVREAPSAAARVNLAR
jgi:hypothetical protein